MCVINLQAGGFVAEGRINGSLNLSRALGDMDYKQSKNLGPNAQVLPSVPIYASRSPLLNQ